jgi:hypothetical protein
MDWTPVAAALSAVTVEWLQPLNVVLVIGLVMFARYMHKANQRSDFDLVDALRGPDGKASMKLIGYLVGIILGSWALMDCASTWQQKPEQFVEVFGLYLVLLVAPKIAAEWIAAKYSPKRDDKDRPHADDH